MRFSYFSLSNKRWNEGTLPLPSPKKYVSTYHVIEVVRKRLDWAVNSDAFQKTTVAERLWRSAETDEMGKYDEPSLHFLLRVQAG